MNQFNSYIRMNTTCECARCKTLIKPHDEYWGLHTVFMEKWTIICYKCGETKEDRDNLKKFYLIHERL